MNFTKVWFTQNKTHPCEVYRWMAFDKGICLYSHHHNQDIKHLHSPRKFPRAVCSLSPSSPAPGRLMRSVSAGMILPYGVMHCVLLCVWLLSARCSWDSSPLLCVSVVCPFLFLSGASLHGCTTIPLSNHLLMNIWLVCIFWSCYK